MKIYVFTICTGKELTVVQIYSTGRIKAKKAIVDIHGCNVKHITYQGEDTTTGPLGWYKHSF